MKTQTLTEKNFIEVVDALKGHRPLFKSHTPNGSPVFFYTVDDKKRSKRQIQCYAHNWHLTNISEYK